jgi:hypothetical protein
MFGISFLYAQTDPGNNPRSNEEYFTQAELVIEGQFSKVVATYDTKGNGNYEDCYRIEVVNVQRVYKGDSSLAGKIIYIVQKGAVLGEEFVFQDRETEINSNGEITSFTQTLPGYIIPDFLSKNGINYGINRYTPSIFFLRTSEFPELKASAFFPYKKYVHFEKKQDDFESYNFMYVCGDIIAGLNDLIFFNHDSFYNYLKQFEGFTVPNPTILLENNRKKEN